MTVCVPPSRLYPYRRVFVRDEVLAWCVRGIIEPSNWHERFNHRRASDGPPVVAVKDEWVWTSSEPNFIDYGTSANRPVRYLYLPDDAHTAENEGFVLRAIKVMRRILL